LASSPQTSNKLSNGFILFLFQLTKCVSGQCRVYLWNKISVESIYGTESCSQNLLQCFRVYRIKISCTSLQRNEVVGHVSVVYFYPIYWWSLGLEHLRIILMTLTSVSNVFRGSKDWYSNRIFWWHFSRLLSSSSFGFASSSTQFVWV
jgi:hypothetical protein